MQWLSTTNKTSPVNGETTRNHVNQAVRDNGSRFGFKVTQQLGEAFMHCVVWSSVSKIYFHHKTVLTIFMTANFMWILVTNHLVN
ncbi:hypothetical protein [Haemophilus paraphrohaemolyticus]|uniref:hypothetical protein n=1 Tax=Haemophilus paraphrohaemolyticus TaxID=736 RepID=UPI001788B77A|nr:hypothetical protein [Haemophilus paraphrohaemolyticus]